MKNKLMSMASAGVLALGCLSASANTITVGAITTASDGNGGVDWTYPIIFNNSQISSGQPTAFNVNDFGPLRTVGGNLGALGYSFAPVSATAVAVPFTLDNSQFLAPNFGAPLNVNNPAALDVLVTFTGNALMAEPSVTFNLVLDTTATLVGGLANFTSQDIVQSGSLSGTVNKAQQNILTPQGVPLQGPDGGTTAMLLGAALSALGLIRRKLA